MEGNSHRRVIIAVIGNGVPSEAPITLDAVRWAVEALTALLHAVVAEGLLLVVAACATL